MATDAYRTLSKFQDKFQGHHTYSLGLFGKVSECERV